MHLLLPRRQLQRVELEAGDLELPGFPGPIMKDSYRRWAERDSAGNAIGSFIQLLGMSFHETVCRILGGSGPGSD